MLRFKHWQIIYNIYLTFELGEYIILWIYFDITILSVMLTIVKNILN